MRIDTSKGQTAAEWVNTASKKEIETLEKIGGKINIVNN